MAQRERHARTTAHSTCPLNQSPNGKYFKYNDYLKFNLVCYLSIFPLQFLNVYEMSHEAFCMTEHVQQWGSSDWLHHSGLWWTQSSFSANTEANNQAKTEFCTGLELNMVKYVQVQSSYASNHFRSSQRKSGNTSLLIHLSMRIFGELWPVNLYREKMFRPKHHNTKNTNGMVCSAIN